MKENIFHVTDDERILVYVCHKCNKLIGTKENHYLIIKNRKKQRLCEGCYDERT